MWAQKHKLLLIQTREQKTLSALPWDTWARHGGSSSSKDPQVGLEEVQSGSWFWEAQERVTLAVEFSPCRTCRKSAFLPDLLFSCPTSSTEGRWGRRGRSRAPKAGGNLLQGKCGQRVPQSHSPHLLVVSALCANVAPRTCTCNKYLLSNYYMPGTRNQNRHKSLLSWGFRARRQPRRTSLGTPEWGHTLG